jgi:hypothetical protein
MAELGSKVMPGIVGASLLDLSPAREFHEPSVRTKQADDIDLKVIEKRIRNLQDASAFINDTVEGHKDEFAFRRIVEWAIEDCGIEPVELARAFDSNTGTVSRWRTGKNAPHTRERPRIIAWLKDAINSRADELKAELANAKAEHARARAEREPAPAGRQRTRKS